MTFSFSVPGQPPSVNHTYKIVRLKLQDGRTIQKLGKEGAASSYQSQVSLLCRLAKPAAWSADGQIRVMYDFHLARDTDCDNLLKVINDGIQWGLGSELDGSGRKFRPIYNDKLFLPCVRSKTTGNKEPYVEVTISG